MSPGLLLGEKVARPQVVTDEGATSRKQKRNAQIGRFFFCGGMVEWETETVHNHPTVHRPYRAAFGPPGASAPTENTETNVNQ